jgi:hypothetical protein
MISLSDPRLPPRAAFFALLALGLLLFRDYGYSWDEEASRLGNGYATYQLLTKFRRAPLELSGEKYHGAAFETVLMLVEKGLRLKDTRVIYLLRHLLTFLVHLAAVAVFYRLLRVRFASRAVGLLGAAFLVLSPRIFADGFYNSKDATFLDAYIFALATLVRFLSEPRRGTAALHAAACGFLIDIRILGVIVPVLTVGMVVLHVLARRRLGEPAAVPWRALALNLGLTAVFTTLFWPVLWKNPPREFLAALQEMGRYPWSGHVLYLGEMRPATELPWHYLPCWILVTTPLLYTGLFVVGFGCVAVGLLRRPVEMFARRPVDLLMAAALAGPLSAVLVLHATIYDGWRHLYFIYPAFLFLAVLGFTVLRAGVHALDRRWRLVLPAFRAAWAVPLVVIAWGMVRDHPYQNVYFNVLAGPDLQTIKSRFELDYWGLSCRAGLERLLRKDPAPWVTVFPDSDAVIYSAVMLRAEDRQRLHFTHDLAEADYYASHYRPHWSEFPPEKDFCTVEVGNAKLFVVQKQK